MSGSEEGKRRGRQAAPAGSAARFRTFAMSLALLVLVVATVAGALFWQARRQSPLPPEAQQGAPRDPYEVQDPHGTGARFNIVLRPRADEEEPDPKQAAEIARLEALGYASGSMEGRGRSGVTLYEADLASAGLNLYIDGQSPTAYLMDMEGTVLHRWNYPFGKAFPKRRLPPGATAPGFFRRVHLSDNGDLLAIFEGQGMIKLDRDSKLLWAYHVRTHHDVQVMQDGTIYVLARRSEMVRRISSQVPVQHDAIDVLTPYGRRIRRVSLLEAFERSRFSGVLEQLRDGGDIFHTNSLRILDGRFSDVVPAFKAGNALISILRLNMIAVVDMQRDEIVWTLSGGWYHQHESVLLDDGRILLFDNGRDRFSRVLEVDPRTEQVLWQYGGPGVDFYSRTCGTAQRLPNGNTLITETDQGRAFEVTRDKRTVWEFHTPHRSSDDERLIASLFQVQRLAADFPVDWAQAPGQPSPAR